jgi:hypothetical protein
MANKKQLGRLEHHLQMSKIKLSVSRNENATLKKRIQELRRDKLLHLQILNDLVSKTFSQQTRSLPVTYHITSIDQGDQRREEKAQASAERNNSMQ